MLGRHANDAVAEVVGIEGGVVSIPIEWLAVALLILGGLAVYIALRIVDQLAPRTVDPPMSMAEGDIDALSQRRGTDRNDPNRRRLSASDVEQADLLSMRFVEGC